MKSRKLQVRQSERGYMLITMMLVIALAAMALLAVFPEIGQQIKRDREEEMCHRGTQYMRAIQHFYKKTGRFPTRVEELENTNNIRFLRKRYKDPLNRDPETGKERDFKFLHQQDVNLTNGPMLGQAIGPGGLPGLGNQPGMTGPGGALQQGLQGALGQMQQLGGMQQQGASPTANANSDDESQPGDSSSPKGSSSTSSSSQSSSSPFSTSPNATSGSTSGTGLGGQVFGGGPILGVASLNKKDKTIREYNKKNHYNEWLFMYDPTSDRGGLLVGPWQTPTTPTLQGATPAGQMGMQPGSGFGQGLQPGGNSFQSQTPQNQGQNPQQQQQQ